MVNQNEQPQTAIVQKKSGGCLTKILAILGGLFLILIGGSMYSTDNDVSSNTSKEPQIDENITYTKVSKDELTTALNNNAAVAKDRYDGAYLEINGRLGTIDSDLKYISIKSESEDFDLDSIHCSITTEEQKSIVKTLTSGQAITVRVKITGVGEVLGYSADLIEIVQ